MTDEKCALDILHDLEIALNLPPGELEHSYISQQAVRANLRLWIKNVEEEAKDAAREAAIEDCIAELEALK